MTKIQFELDGKQVEANAGETIWHVAKRQGRNRVELAEPAAAVDVPAPPNGSSGNGTHPVLVTPGSA